MTRRWILALMIGLIAGPLWAQSVKLPADDIVKLLSGNTAVGNWQGKRYRQFFDPDGTTLYAQEGSRTARGTWRVDPETNEYQSIWPGDADWDGWFVMKYDGGFYWVSKTTPPTPFSFTEGQKLVSE